MLSFWLRAWARSRVVVTPLAKRLSTIRISSSATSQIALDDGDLILRSAQRDIILRELGQRQDGYAAPILYRSERHGVLRLDGAAHPAEEIELPGGVQSLLEDSESHRRARRRGRERGQPILADPLMLVPRLRLQMRQALRGNHRALRARLLDALRRRLEIEILRGEPFFERCQLAIAEATPPLGIRLGAGRAARDVSWLRSERTGRIDRRRDEVGADGARRQRKRHERAEQGAPQRLALRDARRRA